MGRVETMFHKSGKLPILTKGGQGTRGYESDSLPKRKGDDAIAPRKNTHRFLQWLSRLKQTDNATLVSICLFTRIHSFTSAQMWGDQLFRMESCSLIVNGYCKATRRVKIKTILFAP